MIAKDTKLFIATPAFDGKTHIQYTVALADTQLLLSQHGVETKIVITSCGSRLDFERARLCKAFLQSDCTHMLCIDSDLGWPPVAVVKLLEQDEDCVGGLYPARNRPTDAPIFYFRATCKEDGSVVQHPFKQPLLQMQYIPAGFVLIKRRVFEAIIDKFPELYFEPKHESLIQENGHLFFHGYIWEGELWGEDYNFCRRVRDCGFKIYIDPLIQFDHAGRIGSFMDVLSQTPIKNDNLAAQKRQNSAQLSNAINQNLLEKTATLN